MEDGTALIIPDTDQFRERTTQRKIDQRQASNLSGQTNQMRTAASPHQEPGSKSKSSALWFLVGALSLVCVLLVATIIVGAVWFYVQRDDASSEQVRDAPEPGVKEERTSPATKKGALTMENFKKLKTGMSYKQTVEILGGEGDQMSSTEIAGRTSTTYMWSAGTFSNVTLTFQNDKLTTKFQMGLK